MAAGGRKNSPKQPLPDFPEPVSVVDGIPDRSANPRPWKYVALAALFLAWVGFLLACRILGAP